MPVDALPANLPIHYDSSPDVLFEILDELFRRTGVDVREHRVKTIERRVFSRMSAVGLTSPEAYLDLLRQSPHEAAGLLERVSIKVSQFYRNTEAFDLMCRQAIPRLLRGADGRPIRVWCAGCGRGEEAWTLAMLLHSAGAKFSVFATDIDAKALAYARSGDYPTSSSASLPLQYTNAYLHSCADGTRVRVSSELREHVHFSMHDLLSTSSRPDARPFDLISCRNVLIYFQRSAQQRVLESLLDALAPEGLLFLGESEWPSGRASNSVQPISLRARIFSRRASETV